MDEITREIDDARVAYWSHLGRWPRGALVEEAGTLRYETPIPHLPYNGVLRTHLDIDEAQTAIDAVLDSFTRRGVSFVWWVHPSCAPGDLGERLRQRGLAAVEAVAGMSIDLDSWDPDPLPPGVDYVEVFEDDAMSAYEDLIVSYWELPAESQALVSELNRFWGPGRLPAHRWLAYVDDRPVGKVFLLLAGPPGVASVYGMSVTPECRGRGIAGGLTTTLLERAREAGCHRVVLHSSEMAVDVYRRAGFVQHCTFTVYANAPLWASRHR